MKKRFLSLVLCLVMVFSLFPAFGMNAAAAEQDQYGITNPDPVADDSGKLVLSKNLTPGSNGTYDLTIKAYATGTVEAQTVTEKSPTDFVIVVDQSGSMSTSDMATGGYQPATTQYLETIAQQAKNNPPTCYYYKVGDQYYRVYAKRGYLYQYHAANSMTARAVVNQSSMDFDWFDDNQTSDSTNPIGQFFYKEGNEMRLVSLTAYRHGIYFSLRLSYTNGSGSTVYLQRPSSASSIQTDTGNIIFNGTGIFGDYGIRGQGNREDYNFQYLLNRSVYVNHDLYSRHLGYTELCYQDVDGVEHVIPSTAGVGTAQYCNGNVQALTSQSGQRMAYNNLYTASGQQTRLAALKEALTSFAATLAQEEDDNGRVDNKLAIVGFSSAPNNTSYSNTEILTGENLTVSNNNGVQMRNASTSDYATALVDVTNNGTVGTVNPKITAAINAITANGGTQPEYGLEMANSILENRQESTYGDDGQQRNKVVIFFTDGRPGDNDTYNQYEEANDAVEKALVLKNNGALVFSIGVFGESDGNPLTYARYTSSSQVDRYQYEHGYVDTETISNNYYYLFRYWRTGNAAEYGTRANDTIYDYMSVVSSNYPQAKEYIDAGWIAGNFNGNYLQATNGPTARNLANPTNPAPVENKYYRMASNQDTLIQAFLNAITTANEHYNPSTTVVLNQNAVLKDVVDTLDFEVSGANYTVSKQPAKLSGETVVEEGTATVLQPTASVPASGVISVTGYDYSTEFLREASGGSELVITVTGLVPKHGGELTSNDGDAAIYANSDAGTAPTVAIGSPVLNIADTLFIIDYNVPVKLTESLGRDSGVVNGEAKNFADGVDGHNGVYAKNSSTLTYQLFTGLLNPTTGGTSSGGSTQKYSVTLNSAFEDVDNALFIESGSWKSFTTLPANAVYYSDPLTTSSVTISGDGDSGKNTGVVSNAAAFGSADEGKQVTFTFTGTGIDVYSTTNADGKYIVAYLLDASGANVLKTMSMKNYSSEERCNVPSIFFHDLDYGTYQLRLYASKGANYMLDGIRVYNPAGDSAAAQEAYLTKDEGNATFTNLRDLILESVDSEFPAEIPEGVGFFVDQRPEGAAAAPEYILDAYRVDGPKNEVYLLPDTAIAFTILNWEAVKGCKIMVGVSSPSGDPAKISVNGKDVEVTGVDQYYDVTPDDGVVMVANVSAGETLISLTNMKITGLSTQVVVGPIGASTLSADASDSGAKPLVMNIGVDEETVSYAANFNVLRQTIAEQQTADDPAEPDAPADDEQPLQSLVDLIRQLLSEFVRSLFSSVARLFGK